VLARHADAHAPAEARVGVIGLGAGTLATYARPGQEWTFFEINPAVIDAARDPARFTYLADAFPEGARVVVGDARLELARDPGGYGLLVIDAFSSDAIPVHLVTLEAMRLYASKVAPGAVIAWHVTNRSLDLRPVLAEAAQQAGWAAWVRQDFELSEADAEAGKAGSMWVAMAEAEAALAPLAARGWTRLERRAGFPARQPRAQGHLLRELFPGQETLREDTCFEMGKPAPPVKTRLPR